jgi:uncharacterized membrane protein
MALRAISPLTPDPSSAKRPLKSRAFAFSVQLVDVKAPAPTDRTIEVSLAAGNDLQFAGGVKTVTRTRKVGATAVDVTLNETISGTVADLGSFRVTLRETGGKDLAACFVNLE